MLCNAFIVVGLLFEIFKSLG